LIWSKCPDSEARADAASLSIVIPAPDTTVTDSDAADGPARAGPDVLALSYWQGVSPLPSTAISPSKPGAGTCAVSRSLTVTAAATCLLGLRHVCRRGSLGRTGGFDQYSTVTGAEFDPSCDGHCRLVRPGTVTRARAELGPPGPAGGTHCRLGGPGVRTPPRESPTDRCRRGSPAPADWNRWIMP
jgi:hypothetical protein